MPTDWIGIIITILIILIFFLIIVAKIQGDRVVDVITQFFDLIKGK